jgi:hypothetical protein
MKTILSLSDKKGISLVECIVALFLTTIAMVSLMSMQPLAWKGAGRSDYLGRAEGILQSELETRENNIMQNANACTCNGITPCTCSATTLPCNCTYTNVQGGTPFTINVQTTAPNTTTCLTNVQLTWPGTLNGIESSILVSNVSMVPF